MGSKSLEQLHGQLAPDVREAAWHSNCAGEVFVDDGSERGLRIGHFQGDAALAAFVVAAHESCRPKEIEG